MYAQAPDPDLGAMTALDPMAPPGHARGVSARVPHIWMVLVVTSLLVAFGTDAARAQIRAFKLTHGHISQLIVDQRAQLARMVRVDADGTEVGGPFTVLVQHRSGPEDQAIDERWAWADSIITCFPASIADPQIRAKAILNDKTGAIQIRRYASGLVIVEPGDGHKQPDPTLLAGPVQE